MGTNCGFLFITVKQYSASPNLSRELHWNRGAAAQGHNGAVIRRSPGRWFLQRDPGTRFATAAPLCVIRWTFYLNC